MVARLIHWSIDNRGLVALLAFVLLLWGLYGMRQMPLDAIPDLSDTQVIVRTTFPGQAPQVVEDQVTYPLTTALMAVPGATTVRGFSMFGDSFVYVLFEDGTDPYWARTRVLEYLNQAAGQLPPGITPQLGPDATGVGWVYQYTLVDRTGTHDLAQLRSIQDWFLRFELQGLPGVAEVATVGGMVRQYQVVVDPMRLRAHAIPVAEVRMAIERGNQEHGGSVIELAEAEYMVRTTGYVQRLEDLRAIPLKLGADGTPVLLGDVAEVRLGPEMRRGIAELDGEGEVVGGIIVMRHGANALTTIRAVKERLNTLAAGLPPGVEIVETYDRSALIERAVANLQRKLIEEFLIVTLVCVAFLLHLRSSLVVVISLPLGILAAFGIMYTQGITANIMSLGGIAIAVGTMVDAAIVMIENAHKHLERAGAEVKDRWKVIAEAATEVGPPIFFSLVVVTVSFLPVFALQAQEGRLFTPLAYTKTYAMAAAAILSVTLVPVLMGWFIRGRIRPERANPVNRATTAVYRPFISLALERPWWVVGAAVLIVLLTLPVAKQLGSEFMPELDEGDLMYMPTTFPGLSPGKAQELLQQTDRMIAQVPEVARVFGKIGRAETATDPAPLTMIETTILLKPREEWRPGMTMEKLKQELDAAVQVPGIANAWVFPIKTRIDMLATGIKTPVGIKVSGPDLAVIDRVASEIEAAIADIPGTVSAFADRSASGRYLEVDVDRIAAARYGLNIADVHEYVAYAVGGLNIGRTVEGLERYPINLRYPQQLRDNPEALHDLPVITANGATVALGEVARIRIVDGPAEIKSENARPTGWVYVDIRDRDLGSYVREARERVAERVTLPPGYSVAWSGQFEYLQRAQERLRVVVPATLAIIVVLLYLAFRRWAEVAIVLGTLPFALVGGVWLLWALDYNVSVAVGVGFIALAGVAAETGVVMLVYLNQALASVRERARAAGRVLTHTDLHDAVIEGALMRLRPKLMTVLSIIAGLLPIMWGTGTGSEVMRRIATPMVGGLVSAAFLTLVVIPAVFLLWHRRSLTHGGAT